MDHTDPGRPHKAPRLTDDDRRLIAEARKLAALDGDAVRAQYGPQGDSAIAYARAFGAAQWWLGELAAIAERAEPSPPGDTRRLGEIRALLAAFDWEHDDRQYALEAIKRIAEGGQS